MEAWIRLHEDFRPAHLFHLLQPLSAGRLELLHNLRIHPQHDVALLQMPMHLAELNEDLVADRNRRLRHAGALADGAGRRERAFQRLLHTLARDRNQTEVVELKNLRWSTVLLQLLFERDQNLLAILALIHVDEVDDDDT